MQVNRLRNQRIALGWTQQKTAERLGLSLRTYSRHETHGPTKTVQLLMDCLVKQMGYDLATAPQDATDDLDVS